MRTSTARLVIALTLALLPGPNVRAEQPTPPAPTASVVSLRVQVVIATFQGEKKVSSVPYTLSVNAGSLPFAPNAVPAPFGTAPSQLRMGVKVPIPSMAPPTVDGKRLEGIPTGGGPVFYQDVGTNIDCLAFTMEDGRFQLQISVEDESISEARGVNRPGEPPMIRTFRLSNQVILRDGQSTQFTAATDRVTGEVVRVEVTVNVAK
jgi:hypothetical protein